MQFDPMRLVDVARRLVAPQAEGDSSVSEETREARRLLDAYQALPYKYGDKVAMHPEGRAILERTPPVQVAAIVEALDRVEAIGSGQNARWQQRWRLLELAKTLLRRRQPFTEQDLDRLLRHLLSEHQLSWYLTPSLEIIRAAASYGARSGLSASQRRMLQQVRATVLAAHDRGKRRKALEVLDQMLGSQDEEQGPEPGREEPEPSETELAALRGEAEQLVATYLDEAQERPRPEQTAAGEALAGTAAHPALFTVALDLAAAGSLQAIDEWQGQPAWRDMDRETLRRLSAVNEAWRSALDALVRAMPPLPVWAIRRLLRRLADDPRMWTHMWHRRELLTALLQQVESRRLVSSVRDELRALRQTGADHNGRYHVREMLVALDELLSEGQPSPIEAVDTWGEAAQEALDRMAATERKRWLPLLFHARRATGARPGKAWLKEARTHLETVGLAAFGERAAEWLGFLDVSPAGERGETRDRTSPLTPTEANAALLKGVVWMCGLLPPADLERLAPVLAEAADRSFKKVPGAGPRAVGVGNACIQALGQVEGMPGVLRLQWLRHRVAYIPALKLIDQQLEAAARRAGLEKDELEELLVPDFGLAEARLVERFGDYTVELALTPRDAVELRWSKAGTGARLKSEPAAAKREHGDEIKALKATVEEIRQVLPTQRARLERLLLAERSWPMRTWRERHLDHGLLSHLARRLIWSFGAETSAHAGIWLDGRIVDAEDRPLEGVSDETPVRLWHPLGQAPEDVLAWRRWLERHGVTQPFKQAHREVYLLTDAELGTRTYSNRFAAHILRQHQMHALAQQRGWKAPLALVYDGSWDATLSLQLPRLDLRAEYFVEGVLDDTNPEAGYNDNGVCLYVATDQVRFVRAEDGGEPVPLVDVPPLAFSEVMRDVDLFVGVTSVGNDPTWRDAGPERHRTYWERYAFGELGESAKTRKAVLERLLPRLTKLAGRWSLEDRFLVIRGDLRTYKIHLGSANILMAPNDQYLCIVPDRRTAGDAASGGELFLPFQGDGTLAVILSKTLLLVDDRSITDPTITRQIGRATV